MAIVASSRIEKDSGAFKFLKQQLTPSHTSQLAIVIFDAWRDGWGSDTGRSVSKMESYVRSLGFNANSIKLRMLFDPRCPIKLSGPKIGNLTVSEVESAGFVLFVGGNGQALLQAAYSTAGVSVIEAIAAAIADPSRFFIIQSWSAGSTCLGQDTHHSRDKEKELVCSLNKFKGTQIEMGFQFFGCSFTPHIKERDLPSWVNVLSLRCKNLKPIIPITDGCVLVMRRDGPASIVTENDRVLDKQLRCLEVFRKALGLAPYCNLVPDHAVCIDCIKRKARLALGPARKIEKPPQG